MSSDIRASFFSSFLLYRILWGVGVKRPVHLFLGGKGLGIQQGTSVWVGSPRSNMGLVGICENDSISLWVLVDVDVL